MIRATDLGCAHGGRQVLRDVELVLHPGKIVGLLGPNGSGKTTLISTLAGILPPAAGHVTHGKDRADVHAMSACERARRIACVPQRAETTFALRCCSVVLMGRWAHQRGWLSSDSAEDHELARSCMRQAGIESLWDRPVDQISGGELQRVLFARALAQEAKTLLLDEPTASMDLAGTVALFDLVRELALSGTSALVAVHDINLAALYCDHLYFLKDGRVAAQGPTRDVFDEQTLSHIFGTRVLVGPHPGTGAPQAHFVPGGGAFTPSGASSAPVRGGSGQR